MSGNKKHGCSHTRAVEYNTPQDDDSKIVQFVKRTRLSKKRESTVHSIEHRAASPVIPIVSSTNVIPTIPLRSVLSSEITETITPTLIPFSASSSSSPSAESSSRANSNDQLLNNKRKKQKHHDDDKIDARVNPRKKRHLTRVRNSTQPKKKKQDTRKNRQEQKTKETEKEQEVDMLSVHNKKDRDEKITNSEPSRLASTIPPPPPPIPIPTHKTTSSHEDEVASHKSRYKVAIDMIGQKFFEPLRRKLAERIANLINVSTMQTQTYDTFLRDDVPTIMRNSELLIDYIPDADRIDDEDDEASSSNVRLPVFSASSPSSSSSSSSSSTPSNLIVPVTTNPTPNKKYGSSHAALAAAAAATEMNTTGELHVLGEHLPRLTRPSYINTKTRECEVLYPTSARALGLTYNAPLIVHALYTVHSISPHSKQQHAPIDGSAFTELLKVLAAQEQQSTVNSSSSSSSSSWWWTWTGGVSDEDLNNLLNVNFIYDKNGDWVISFSEAIGAPFVFFQWIFNLLKQWALNIINFILELKKFSPDLN